MALSIKPSTEYKPRKFESIAVLFSGIMGLGISAVLSNCFLLIGLYGWKRVVQEELIITAMPHGKPWVVSNGDVLGEEVVFIHFLSSSVLFILISAVFFLGIRKLLPLKVEAELVEPAVKKKPSLNKKVSGDYSDFSYVDIFRVISFLWGILWFAISVVIMDHFKSKWGLLVVVAHCLVTLYGYSKFRSKYWMAVMRRLKCRKCGRAPMGSTVFLNDLQHRFVICEGCDVKCDLGGS